MELGFEIVEKNNTSSSISLIFCITVAMVEAQSKGKGLSKCAHAELVSSRAEEDESDNGGGDTIKSYNQSLRQLRQRSRQ